MKPTLWPATRAKRKPTVTRTADPAAPSFAAWSLPMMLAGGFVWAVGLVLLLAYDRVFLLVELDGLGNSGPLGRRAEAAVGQALLLMPVLSSLYLTTFLTGLAVHRRSTAPGKALNFASLFVLSRIADIWLSGGLFMASALLLIGASAPGTVAYVLAPLAGGLLVAGCTWLLHRYGFAQSPGSGRRWLVAHIRRYVFALVLLVIAVLTLFGLPASAVPAAAPIGLAILPLPHLHETYKVWRRHHEAERQLAHRLSFPNRYAVLAGAALAVILAVELIDPGASRIGVWETLQGRTYF